MGLICSSSTIGCRISSFPNIRNTLSKVSNERISPFSIFLIEESDMSADYARLCWVMFCFNLIVFRLFPMLLQIAVSDKI